MYTTSDSSCLLYVTGHRLQDGTACVASIAVPIVLQDGQFCTVLQVSLRAVMAPVLTGEVNYDEV